MPVSRKSARIECDYKPATKGREQCKEVKDIKSGRNPEETMETMETIAQWQELPLLDRLTEM